MPFQYQQTKIKEVIHITYKAFHDSRGFFSEILKSSDFKTHGISDNFVQANYSFSHKNVVRGLHFQKHPRPQGKLITVFCGEIFDVAVDIRKGSPTYGKWVGAHLSEEKGDMLYIPAGFAHGFCVLSENARVVYFCTQEYAPDCEKGIKWDDPVIGIDWPISHPVLSDRDLQLPVLDKADNNFIYTSGKG
jgi:dTDP-4-dehydrorhamnose 3,5-epimerase